MNYPFQGVSDDFLDVCYRAQSNALVDQTLFPIYFTYLREIASISERRNLLLYIYTCRVDKYKNSLQQSKESIKWDLFRLPPSCLQFIHNL